MSQGCSAEQDITGLQPDTDYTLWARVKSSDASTVAKIGVKGYGGTETNVSSSSSAYALTGVNFKTGANSTSARIYLWNSDGSGSVYGDDFMLLPRTAVFRDFTNAWKVSNVKLGLGKGFCSVKKDYTSGVSTAMGALNSKGTPVVLMANESASATTTDVVFNNISFTGNPTVTAYTSAPGYDGETGVVLNKTIYSDHMTCTVELPAYSTVGIIADGAYNILGGPGVQANQIYNFGFEENYSQWSNSGTAVNHDQKSGSFCIEIQPGDSTEQLITGLYPNKTYILKAWMKTTNGSTGFLGVKEYGGNEINTSTNSGTYSQLTTTFTTGAASTQALIYLSNGSVTEQVYGDDLELYIQN